MKRYKRRVAEDELRCKIHREMVKQGWMTLFVDFNRIGFNNPTVPISEMILIGEIFH